MRHKSLKIKSKSKRSKKNGKCRKYLGKKIGINMAEYKAGRWSSPAQAIAVSYSETLKKFPHCKQHLKRSKSRKRKSAMKM